MSVCDHHFEGSGYHWCVCVCVCVSVRERERRERERESLGMVLKPVITVRDG